MADQDESVREFVAVTDVDEERARFFLESAGWDLQVKDNLIPRRVTQNPIKEWKFVQQKTAASLVNAS